MDSSDSNYDYDKYVKLCAMFLPSYLIIMVMESGYVIATLIEQLGDMVCLPLVNGLVKYDNYV